MSTITQAQPRTDSKRQLLIAGVLGLIAAVLVIIFLNSVQSESTEVTGPTTSILISSQSIAAGTKITDAMLARKEVPESAVSAEVFTDKSLVAGKVARYPIEKGEAIVVSRLVDGPKIQALSFQIPAGMRGMSIPVEISKTPAALIAPGDFVDVIVSADASLLGRLGPLVQGGNANEAKGSATLVQNVQVLSVDRSYVDNGVVYDASVRGEPPKSKDNISFLTLAVSPNQAQLLWLAQDSGKLTVVLRAFGDDNVQPLAPRFAPLANP
jgi:pilus assembly protein CpaB